MYDAREKAIRDRNWEIGAAERKGEAKGEIKVRIEMIQMLQGLLGVPVTAVEDLRALGLKQLQAMTSELQEKLRTRSPS
jgi:hypothetical protein